LNRKKFDRERLKKGIRIFLFVSFIIITIILIFTVSRETKEELKLISPLFIILTLFSVFLRFFFDIWRLRYIVNAMGKDLSWMGAFYFTLGGLFLGAVTPMQIGGIPLQLYVCKREGISLPEGSAAIFTRGLLSAFVLPFLIPFMFYYRVYLTTGMIQGIVKYLSIFYGLMAFAFIVILTKTEWVRKIFKGKFINGFVRFKEIFREEFVKRKSLFFRAYGITWLSLIFYFLTAPLLMNGLGISAPFFETTILQVILTYALNFMPTPGASGFAEGGAYILFRHLMPKSILGVYVVLWRFFTGYLGVIIGGIALSRLFATRGSIEEVFSITK